MQVKISEFTLKGYGTGLLPNGKEVEVPHAVRGDELLIEWKKKKRSPQKGRIQEVIKASENRVTPPCEHAQICGGCCWQQMSYPAQLAEKEARVKKSFKNQYPVDPILPADPIFGYRNKMEFTFSQNRGGMRYLGLMIAAAEPYVFNLEKCHLGPSWYSDVVKAIRGWWENSGLDAYNPPLDTGTLRYLTLRHGMRTGQKMVILNVSGRPEFAPPREQLDLFVDAIRKALGEEENVSIFIRIHQTKKGTPTQFFEMSLFGPDHIEEELHLKTGKLRVKISPSSFFQPNTYQAERLYDTALEALPLQSSVFDLYSGTGTLGLAAAFSASQVIGIELSAESVLDAEENKKRNGIQNATFYQGDVGRVLTQLLAQKDFPRADVAIVDPPRAGLDPLAIHHLKTLLPKQIIYISCNPITQAENVLELIDAGYRLTRLQPVDQFPHTYHIENIAFLER